ncbi:MAG: efflux RND transporter periplasmic adaptor subunit [Hyphomicrobiales bacterium]|nr:efflux RND transporter periplasmic adaptor subunit [Hyphomicrobiales bacterium]
MIVEKVEMKDLTAAETFTGRIEATDTVQIMARVTGFLKGRHFVQGSLVKKGSLLFEIDAAPFRIALDQAQANLASAKAAQNLAQQTFDRNQALSQRNVASKAQLDSARAALEQAKAVVAARVSDVDKAKLDLSYTRITAPIDGLIGRAAVSEGAYITASTGALATLVRRNPIYVTFPVPQRTLAEVRKAGKPANGAAPAQNVYVEIVLSDGSKYQHRGTIKFFDVQATVSTDAVLVRAEVPNPDGLLVDRQVVEAHVVRKAPERKLVMSQSAMLLDQKGPYALVVGDDNKVVMRRISTGEQQGPLIVVTDGLKAGERVIVSGQQKARPGVTVAPQAASGPAGQTQ